MLLTENVIKMLDDLHNSKYTHPFRCDGLDAASPRLPAAPFLEGFLPEVFPFDGPSIDGGVEAFEVIYGSGEALELEFNPLPHPSLEGLGWKLWKGSPWSPESICVGSICVKG